MEFYNVKTRQKVEVPDAQLTKQKFEKETSKGTQTRYAVTATVDGTKLFKFVNQATYSGLNVPEAS